jgi:hypothetical protein
MITIGYSTKKSDPEFKEYLKKSCGHPKIQIIEKVNNFFMILQSQIF